MPGNRNAPKRGEVWWANLGELNPAKGAEIQKTRPVLIIGHDVINRARRTALVIPLATSGGTAEANPPITVRVECAGKKGVAVIDQLRALDKNRLLSLIDTIHASDMQLVVDALSQVLEI
jgi:mRNA interferase MazF